MSLPVRIDSVRLLAIGMCLACAASPAYSQATRPTTSPATTTAARGAAVVRDQVQPHWLDAERFWYRNDLTDGRREFVYVDAAAGVRRPAFDAARLAEALAGAIGRTVEADRLPIDIEAMDETAATISVGGIAWRCDLFSYELVRVDAPATTSRPATTEATRNERRGNRRRSDAAATSTASASPTSPDGQLSVSIRDGNLFLRSAAGGEERPLSTDGTDEIPYERVFWSPDSTHLVAFRVERGDHKVVYRLESTPDGANAAREGPVKRAELHQNEYPLPGDKLDAYELHLFNVATGEHIRPPVERIDTNEWSNHPDPQIRWRPDGRHFLYEKHDRGHQRLRLMEVDAHTGAARAVIDEQSKTFIWTAHREELDYPIFQFLQNDREVLYASEQSGWRHLYLVDIASGSMKSITSGEWVLRRVLRVDESKRQVWFAASGIYPGQDPYLLHFGRVNFDGSGLVWLTSSDGQHSLIEGGLSRSLSPDERYLIVKHSRVDAPPVTELRRTGDGQAVVELERAEVGPGWRPPEVFVSKGRDGATDIWGIIVRPPNFDPTKRYPIIEDIYAGPHSSHVPKSFSARNRWESLANLGFIVVKIDGMGTANRSKAFHDVCWHNLKDAGFPDRIKWIQAAAQRYPYMDATRVGVFGTSAGGQNAAGALLFHGDFYKAAVANCGCHDNRMDKSSWNEQWMGYPVGPHYAESSNIDNAGRLKGHLQLVLGEMDDNVPVESTFRLVDALVKQRKEFDFVFIPGGGHGANSPITERKLQDFFVRHLQGIQPANPN